MKFFLSASLLLAGASTQVAAQSIAQVAVDSSLTTLVTALEAADFFNLLDAVGPTEPMYTVFAPTNEAFDQLPDGALAYLLEPDNQLLLQDLLQYHVLEGVFNSSSLMDGLSTPTLLTGGTLEFMEVGDGNFTVAGANISTVDIMAENGIVHLVDSVLMPMNFELPPSLSMFLAGNYSILASLIVEAGLNGTLEEDGPYTIFAPIDEAFGELSEGLSEYVVNSEGVLATLLTYHVVEGRVRAADLTDGQEITTLQGDILTVSIMNDTVMINDVNVTMADDETLSAVVHGVDGILIPPGFMPPTIYDILSSSEYPELSTLKMLVDLANLTEVFSDMNGTYTVFAPNDDAFGALDPELVANLTDPMNVENLTDVLQGHVVDRIVGSDDIMDGLVRNALNGQLIFAVDNTTMEVTVNNITIETVGIYASNGVVHIISGVISPMDLDQPETTDSPGGSPGFGGVTPAPAPGGATPAPGAGGEEDGDRDITDSSSPSRRERFGLWTAAAGLASLLL